MPTDLSEEISSLQECIWSDVLEGRYDVAVLRITPQVGELTIRDLHGGSSPIFSARVALLTDTPPRVEDMSWMDQAARFIQSLDRVNYVD